MDQLKWALQEKETMKALIEYGAQVLPAPTHPPGPAPPPARSLGAPKTLENRWPTSPAHPQVDGPHL